MSERDLFIDTYLDAESDIYAALSDVINDIDVIYRWDNFDIAQTFDNTKFLICYKMSNVDDDILDSKSLEAFIKEMYELKFRRAIIITNYKFLDKTVAEAISEKIKYNIHIDIKMAKAHNSILSGIYKLLFILCIIVCVYTGINNIIDFF